MNLVKHSIQKASRLLLMQHLYLVLLDSSSSINNTEEEEKALAHAGHNKRGEVDRFQYHEYWAEHQNNKELLMWAALWSGVFRIHFHVLDPDYNFDPPRPMKTAFVGGDNVDRIIHIPSGDLLLCAPNHLGKEKLEPVMSVEPGDYRAALFVDDDEQEKHEFLEGIRAYPNHDGPDWIVYLQKI